MTPTDLSAKDETEMSYAIELIHTNGADDFFLLHAGTSEAEAIARAEEWASGSRQHGTMVFLAVHRQSDGFSGYINRDGVSSTGKTWGSK